MQTETRVPVDGPIYLQWGPIFAGAFAAAALAFVLHAFAAAIGISVSSTSPTWRDGSWALWVLTGIYLLLVALASYSLGGYVAGRTRLRLTAAPADEVEIRDGAHGIIVWALATLMTGLLALGVAQSLTRLAAPSGDEAGAGTSFGAENIIAYDIDRLFRSERPPQGDLSQARAEAGRILLTAAGHSGVSAEDRTYLIRMVSARTGTAAPDAERRVDAAIAGARDNIGRAHKSSVLIGFMAGASALLGAVAAWFAACAGGRHRDGGVAMSSLWATARTRRAPAG